ncbi:hypothetical protein D9756_005963 [Leucocoprinus leucothites]|uniref:DUF6593 domain-containing protein n=1 Tax=Leucocoprinus leucothites TaxID=201217 RepID=A0A8H5FX32_9AGAR|nr:hypothetical protein D9756_005963 [Leucoagaricus leucothites]
MIILSESESHSLKSSESTASLYLEPPYHKHSLSEGGLSANSSSISLNTGARTPLPPSPPLSTHPLRNLSQPATPPGYLESRRPATSITYSFAPQISPSNSMILSAPTYIDTPQEAYYISVNMNCFTPSSYITTIRRGSWEGETIGDFEMGLTTPKSQCTVFTRGREFSLSDLLDSSYRVVKTTWAWKVMDMEKHVLYWDDSNGNGMLTCYSSKDRVQGHLLAKFIPPSHPRRHGRSPELTRLEVLPTGHDFIDDIVISVLVIERLRTTPTIPAFH